MAVLVEALAATRMENAGLWGLFADLNAANANLIAANATLDAANATLDASTAAILTAHDTITQLTEELDAAITQLTEERDAANETITRLAEERQVAFVTMAAAVSSNMKLQKTIDDMNNNEAKLVPSPQEQQK